MTVIAKADRNLLQSVAGIANYIVDGLYYPNQNLIPEIIDMKKKKFDPIQDGLFRGCSSLKSATHILQ